LLNFEEASDVIDVTALASSPLASRSLAERFGREIKLATTRLGCDPQSLRQRPNQYRQRSRAQRM